MDFIFYEEYTQLKKMVLEHEEMFKQLTGKSKKAGSRESEIKAIKP